MPAMERRRRFIGIALLAATVLGGTGTDANAGDADARAIALGCAACAALADRLDLYPDTPALLQSFEPRPGSEALPSELATAAFVYDNAVAAIALIACGRPRAARQIGDALVEAVRRDRFYRDGRLRNAYAAGPITVGDPSPVRLPGYWYSASGIWREDAYHVGSATGGTVWGALALLTLDQASGNGEDRYLNVAKRIVHWVNTATIDDRGPGGYRGGFVGHEPSPIRVGWKSTEHNTDVYAANRWLSRRTGEPRWDRNACHAQAFLEAMWVGADGRFLIGTVDDGMTPNTRPSGLDAQLWPLLAVDGLFDRGPAVLAWTRREHGVDGGLDFNTDRDGVWLEGTAQALLVARAFGDEDAVTAYVDTLSAHQVGDGLIFASSIDGLTTGLATVPSSRSDDFVYYRLPHVATAAWTVLAAASWNPFTGGPVSGSATAGLSCPPTKSP